MLESPPQLTVTTGIQLDTRAQSLVNQIISNETTLEVSGEYDIVCSGGFMGVWMVLLCAAQNTVTNFTIHRYAGASAGGKMPFELILKLGFTWHRCMIHTKTA